MNPMSDAGHLFGTVLVANRGEIACRVISTLRRLGIRSVAVHSDADAGARHVREADVAVRIGPAAAAESYLKTDAILEAAKATGAEAIHPGYGFLSENQAFARACGEAGIVFIGPGVEALNVMGDKIRAKNHVAAHGVPVVPGLAEPGLSDAQLAEAAQRIGYPLLIKPSAGGGGKGMHVVERAEELAEALGAARRVAAAAFGDDTLFLERLIAAPRHIEVQVLADNHGRVIHLGERECSLQRRHQKVIEEAPSPLLDAATRARIGQAACEAARSVDYSGAGTVEFLVSDAAPDEFFFMEMNTRLQVEHPVTELVTGLDLVEWQLRIAAGQPLALAQDDVVLTGHAVEARVYAESPERGFLPSAGTVLALQEASGEHVRVDSSLVPGLEIGSSYDPLLSKVIAWGSDRGQALRRLDTALAGTTVLGVETNIEYLRMLVNDPQVAAGHLDTGLIERKLPGFAFRHPGERELAAAALYLYARRFMDGRFTDDGAGPPGPGTSPWARATGWRLGASRPVRFSLQVPPAGRVDVLVRPGQSGPAGSGTGGTGAAAAMVAVGNGPEREAHLRVPAAGPVSITLNGITSQLWLAEERPAAEPADLEEHGATLWLGEAGWTVAVQLRGRRRRLQEQLAAVARADSAAHPDVRSPMPGTVVAVAVESGARVEAGRTILTVEAMKMEHQLAAAVAGTVTVNVRAGDLVKADQVVASIRPETEPEEEGA
jgi:acetyl-CoA/propionyl-CoA carboxylase, biotin carboxylase, biotin carboxyl carrier protein